MNIFKLFKWPRPLYAVIYDVRAETGEDSEEYYGYFSEEKEAITIFDEAFAQNRNVHNVYIVKCIKQLRPHLEVVS